MGSKTRRDQFTIEREIGLQDSKRKSGKAFPADCLIRGQPLRDFQFNNQSK